MREPPDPRAIEHAAGVAQERESAMNRNIVRIMALVGSVGFAGCETTDVVMGELSEIEAQELADVVMFATFSSTGSVPAPAPEMNGPQAVPFAYASEFDGTVQCPLGGAVGIAASFEASGDTESEAGSVEYSMTQIHDGCMATSENDRTFTLWGSPSMNFAFTVENDGRGVVEWAGSVQGAIDWESEGREGSCSVQMEFAGRDEEGATASAQLMGTICGHTVSRSMSIG